MIDLAVWAVGGVVAAVAAYRGAEVGVVYCVALLCLNVGRGLGLQWPLASRVHAVRRRGICRAVRSSASRAMHISTVENQTAR